MWAQIANLFTGLNVIPMIILILGLIFIIIEIFVPGFGIFGIIGSVLSLGGVIARMVMGGTIEQLVIMVLFVVVIVLISFGFMVFSANHGMLKRTPIIESKTSISVDYAKDNKELVKMLGKITFAETDFKPSGKFLYNGELFEASTYGDYISKGTKIQIVEVKADTIFIRKA